MAKFDNHRVHAARARYDDGAAYELATALVHYRQNGRPAIERQMANAADLFALPRALERYQLSMMSDYRPRDDDEH
jgi:hypothetical protein